MVRKILLLILFSVGMDSLYADVYGPAKKRTVFSKNKEYCLKVFPRENYPSKIMDKKIKEYKKTHDTYTLPLPDSLISISLCHAELYRIENADTVLIWNKPLANYDAPDGVLIANDGQTVVTLDDWHSHGFGDVVVVYDENGDVRVSYNLEDLSPFKIEEYLRTVSSIWWCHDAKYLDNSRFELTFGTKAGETRTHIINVKEMPPVQNEHR